MIENIALFYFSGTGNTRIVANLIKEAFQNKSINAEAFAIDALMNTQTKIQFDRYSMIGIGYPIYGFGAPKIIEAFEKLLPLGNKKDVFIFTTAADFISINYNASAFLKKKLRIKGYNVFYERIICMGSNFIVTRSKELEKKLYLAAIDKSEDLCNDVLNRYRRENKLNFIYGGLLNIIHWFEENWLAPVFGGSLVATGECNMCGLCVKNCPYNNISIENKKIKFKMNCLLCMRCVYSCPQKAITSRFFKFFILKDGYDIDSIVKYKDTSKELKTKKIKHFDSYLEDISM